MSKDEIIDRLGEDWSQIWLEFCGMNESQILAELNVIFPTDDNAPLAASIAAGMKYGQQGPSARAKF